MNGNIASQVDGLIGNVIQIPRALHYLIINKGEFVCMEKEDDVSVLDVQRTVLIVEQVKDHKKNIFTDSSEDLWKTIYNWTFDWTKDNSRFTDDTKFIIYSRQKGFTKGNIVKKMEEARSFDQIQEAYEFLKTNYTSTSSANKNIYRPFLLADENKEILYKIIRNFSCSEPDKTLGQDLEDDFDYYCSSWGENLNIFKERIFSWFTKKILKEETKIKQEIEYSRSYFYDYINGELLGIKTLIPLAFEQDIPQYKFENIEDSNFVRQLQLINMEKTNINKNIKDFLIWDTTLNQDSSKGRLTEDTLNNAYKKKRSQWEENKEWIYKTNYAETDELKGFKLYKETTNQETKIGNLIFNEDYEKQVSRGVCNYLANHDPSHGHSIGWHPNYDVELRKGKAIE